MDKLAEIVVNNGIGVGCALMMLWLLWFRETKSIPALFDSFDKARSASTESHRQDLEAAIKAHQQDLALLQEMHKKLQDTFADRNEKTLGTIAKMVGDSMANYQKWHEENRDRLDELAQEIRHNRHLLKGLINHSTMNHNPPSSNNTAS